MRRTRELKNFTSKKDSAVIITKTDFSENQSQYETKLKAQLQTYQQQLNI